MRGLEAIGAEPVAVITQPRSRLVRAGVLNLATLGYLRPGDDLHASVSRARHAARASPLIGTVEGLAARGAVHRAGHLDGIVQIGTGYTLPATTPIVTFEDMTVAQVKTYPYLGWDLLSTRAFNARVAAQRRAYERAIACCLTSPWAAESVVRDYGVPREKVHVVGVGRNHSAASVGDRDWSEPRFLFVGMDWPRKNGDGVIRAFRRLREQLPTARLDIVGGHPSLDVPGVVGHGVLRLDSPDQRTQLGKLYGEATCFVMPSHVEASSIAYVEAAAAGLPSIGTSEGGSDFLIGDGGLIVHPDDDEALFQAMRQLSDSETAVRMGAAAQRRSDLFTWTAVAQRLLDAFAGDPGDWMGSAAAVSAASPTDDAEA
ncbi:MAG TPA: glycosyltransferase family 4 protein [Solirubrobacteraceae bacterium]|jgi:glycosyltransferase involved in cell wall biosynthesis|nr:glycosyltransferase family 4 protein [Solirubrobacteraceae bacterium]